jgi:hypothetical protein
MVGTEGRSQGGMGGIPPVVKGVIEEELGVQVYVVGIVVTSGLVPSKVLIAVCDQPKTRVKQVSSGSRIGSAWPSINMLRKP